VTLKPINANKLTRLTRKAADCTTDLAFDPTIARKCDHQDCPEVGVWRPVLLLQPDRGYTGKPMRVPLGIVVCGQHRERQADRYLDDEMWGGIVTGFKARAMQVPHRSSTRLAFDPHPGSTVAAADPRTAAGVATIEAHEASVDYVVRDAEVRNAPAGLSLEERRLELRRLGLEQAHERARKMFPGGGYTLTDTATDQDIDRGRFRCSLGWSAGSRGDIVKVRPDGSSG
jgi:hypothetical protein